MIRRPEQGRRPSGFNHRCRHGANVVVGRGVNNGSYRGAARGSARVAANAD
jgi:hypothetical protein